MLPIANLNKLFWWPAVFAALTLLTHDGFISVVLVLAMAFHREISVILRRRRFSIRTPTFRCSLDSTPKGSETP